jgi:hypothetical protein
MTKLISALIAVAVIFIGYQLFSYWQKMKKEEETGIVEKAATPLRGDQLQGMPYQMEASLNQAQQKGPEVFRQWLKTYGPQIQDPRKAWIELDFCLAILRDNPAEARRIFADVKTRTGPTSPVWPRVKDLDQTLGGK